MPKSNLEIIEALYEAFTQRDVPTVLSLISPEIQITQSTALPWGGRYSGYEGLHKFLTTLLDHIDSSIYIERVVDAGENIVAIGRTKGSVRANGKPFDISTTHIWRVQNGKVTGLNSYVENAAMLGALNGRTPRSVSVN